MLQYIRRYNLQIDGVPEMQNEKISDQVFKLLTAINEPTNINKTYRLQIIF